MTIRTLEQPVPAEFPPTRLFIDDIEEITRALRELVLSRQSDPSALGTKTEFTFTCGGKSCDDIQEVPKIAKPLRAFSIEVRQGHVFYTLGCDPFHGAIWVPYDLTRDAAWNAFRKLEPIFQKRRRYWSALVHSNAIVSVLAFCVAISLLIPTLGNLLYNRTTHAIAVTTTLLVAATLILVGFLGYLHTFLVPRQSWERSPVRKFLTEKAVGWILGPSLGALALYLLQMLIRKITHRP